MNRARFLVDSQGVVTDRYKNPFMLLPDEVEPFAPFPGQQVADEGWGAVAVAFVVGFLLLFCSVVYG